VIDISILCRNADDDRVIPRMSRYLRDALGWTIDAGTRRSASAVYLSGYFEAQKARPWPDVPTAAYFTHREEEPPDNAKARLFDTIAAKVGLRIATCRKYAEVLRAYGPTIQAPPPVERDRFTPVRRDTPRHPVVGLSGYTYANGRKGEGLITQLLATPEAATCAWRASGRGWPVPTKRYAWEDMPAFYQGLDLLVCTSLVEGVPMPPLEALACGVPVVIPRDVGLLDELPEVTGITRYTRGDADSLRAALAQALDSLPWADPEALRAVTEPYTVSAWCAALSQGMQTLLGEPVTAPPAPGDRDAWARAQSRGIYCVAFGAPAREAALRMMTSAKRHLPEVPIALCAAAPIGPEDVLLVEPDADVGGRRAKLRAYALTPPTWQSVLYLDADTEVCGDIRLYFQLIEDGWEFVICKDPHLMDTMQAYERRNNKVELAALEEALCTLNALQWNGGVWSFGRGERIQRFFQRWQAEWERYAQRDQGALVRAMYTEPLRVYTLGNEWNTFEKYTPCQTAGLMHYPGQARRWSGMIPGRIDSDEAWAMARRFEAERRK
jgi:hypothetical protein